MNLVLRLVPARHFPAYDVTEKLLSVCLVPRLTDIALVAATTVMLLAVLLAALQLPVSAEYSSGVVVSGLVCLHTSRDHLYNYS